MKRALFLIGGVCGLVTCVLSAPKFVTGDETAADVIRETFGETDGTFVILPEEKREMPK